MAGEATSEPPDVAGREHAGVRRRRPPARAEQERRKAWGREWGKVGADYKSKRLEREK